MRIRTKFSVVVAFFLAICMTVGTLSACGSKDEVSLDISEKTVYIGENFLLSAAASNTDDLIWSSDDEDVATVSNGTVTAVGEGDAIIKVKCGTARATCFVVVLKKPESISLDAAEKTLNEGESFTLTATTSTPDAKVVWTTDNPAVATVSNGTVKAVSAGSTTITAKYSTVSAACTVTVIKKAEPQPVYSVKLDLTSKTVEEGQSFTLTATTAPAGAKVEWSSSDVRVATVTNGKVTAVGEGNATVTAKYGTASATCTVKVNKKAIPEPAYSISLDLTSKTLKVGENFTLTTIVSPAGYSVAWSSSDVRVATVTNGKVTAVGEGNATVTAKYGTASATCTVTVNKNQVSGNSYELKFGGKETTCNDPGKWYYMCDGGAYTFASTPEYDNGTVTLAFNSVSDDTTKHFQLRIQPEFAVGTEYTVKFTAKLSAAGKISYGLSNSNTQEIFEADQSKNITAKSTVTAGEPFIIELLPSVRSAPVTLTVWCVEFAKATVVPEPEPEPEPTTLKDKYKNYFPIGAAVTNGSLGNYSALMENFNSVTPENDMKWKFLEPTEGNFSWSNADKIVKWAKQNGAGVRGHCLLWYKSLPDWLPAKVTDKTTALKYIDEHIEKVMTHFGTGDAKDVIYAWDVCNEVLRNWVTSANLKNDEIWRSKETDASAFGEGTVDWYTLCGTDFIKESFKKADEMRKKLGLGNVKLYYNDYGLNDPNKRAACVKLVKMLQDEGIAIDGVGMQAHYKLSNYDKNEQTFLKNFEDSVKAFTELGIDVQITELDVRVYANDGDAEKEMTDEIFAKQGEMYGKILEICRKYSTAWKEGAGKVTGVTTWGISDKSTGAWDTNAHKEYPFIFDEDKKPKKAFEEMMNF